MKKAGRDPGLFHFGWRVGLSCLPAGPVFGGFLSLGEKLFAVPWSALKVDTQNKRFILDADEERLKNAPGFDTDNWPNMADATWGKSVHAYYGTTY
jgi:hypothetical protein